MARMANNRFLAGIAERFGAEAVEAASMEVHRYPAALVGTVAEATAILKHLEAKG